MWRGLRKYYTVDCENETGLFSQVHLIQGIGWTLNTAKEHNIKNLGFALLGTNFKWQEAERRSAIKYETASTSISSPELLHTVLNVFESKTFPEFVARKEGVHGQIMQLTKRVIYGKDETGDSRVAKLEAACALGGGGADQAATKKAKKPVKDEEQCGRSKDFTAVPLPPENKKSPNKAKEHWTATPNPAIPAAAQKKRRVDDDKISVDEPSRARTRRTGEGL